LTGWAEWEKAAEIFSRVEVPPAPPLSPDEALKTFRVAPGFRLELVASEPLVANPIFSEFDPDGRIWAIEYRGYMRDLEGSSEGDPICRVVVLEDTDRDGRADRSTVFLDHLVMPRSFAFVEGGVLVAEPPHLWYCRDLDADLECDSRIEVGRYGIAGNPQHTANGLAYGIDNWLHSADWSKRHRVRDGKLIEEDAVYRGQFGVSFDEAGRYVTCRESSPVEIDLIPEEYLRRNPALLKALQRGRNRPHLGIAVPIGTEANECFPIRPTPAITLGALELREDGTLRTYTIVAGTGVYLGDQFPPDAVGNVFVPEAGGHLIGRLRIRGDVALTAERYYSAGKEILASTDERFRPMSIRTGPDGALYFADMYQGIIEHVIFMAPYLEEQIRQRQLDTGHDMGRIYRLVSTARPIRHSSPRLSQASSEDLAKHLGHSNGWWRITAQRLLVERRDPSIAPALARMVRLAPGHLARLHALWSLDGLNTLDWSTAISATRDSNEIVRAAALRLAERQLQGADDTHVEVLLARLRDATDDPSRRVRLQAALTLGSINSDGAMALLEELVRENEIGLFRTAALSGLGRREVRFLALLLDAPGWSNSSDHREAFLRELAQAVYDRGQPQFLDRVLAMVHDRGEARAWQGKALLAGILQAAPSDLSAVRPLQLEREPPIMAALLASSDRDARNVAWRLGELFTWPGHEGMMRLQSTPLTPQQQRHFEDGGRLYAQLCAACHQPHGGGLSSVAPPLSGSEWVHGPPERLARIVLHGLFGPIKIGDDTWNHHMPGFGEAALTTDDALAAVLTYIRRAWDNRAEPVAPAIVAGVRERTAGRTLPWTAAELLGVTGAESFGMGSAEPIRPDASGTLLLPARLATCFGERLAYRPALDIVAPWRRENDVAVWQIETSAPAHFEIWANLAADEASAGDRFHIETETGRVAGVVEETGSYSNFREQRVGIMALPAGVQRILMRPAGPLKAELCDLRGLRLSPVGPRHSAN
jgi:mono/diheme cytochrome c family protein